MQYPLIKDGVVVNVVEVSESTLCLSKAEYKAMAAKDEAAYAEAVKAWRSALLIRRLEITEAETGLFMARGAAEVIKEQASGKKGKARDALDRVLSADGEVNAWEEKLAAARRAEFPAKPRLDRAPAWIVPEGHELGPVGGNIGDLWDGKAYSAPTEKAA